MASEQAETCRFINTNKLVVFDVPYPSLIVTYTTGMPLLKFMNASQSFIHKFTNLKRELYNLNVNITFNRKCLKKKLTPTYAKIKIPNTSPATNFTQQKLTNIKIKEERKYLHAKKQKLNTQIYHLHLALILFSKQISGLENLRNNLVIAGRVKLYQIDGELQRQIRCNRNVIKDHVVIVFLY